MIFQSHSQAGQDAWVHSLLGDSGTFLDIGCNHPIIISNTYSLERLGWTGFLLDNDHYACELCRQHRTSPVIECDVTKYDWASLPKKDFDYLSLDVDFANFATLPLLLKAGITFKAMTAEHNLYSNGPGPRDEMRRLLLGAGYILAVPDVEHTACDFEDWWLAPGVEKGNTEIK